MSWCFVVTLSGIEETIALADRDHSMSQRNDNNRYGAANKAILLCDKAKPRTLKVGRKEKAVIPKSCSCEDDCKDTAGVGSVENHLSSLVHFYLRNTQNH